MSRGECQSVSLNETHQKNYIKYLDIRLERRLTWQKYNLNQDNLSY